MEGGTARVARSHWVVASDVLQMESRQGRSVAYVDGVVDTATQLRLRKITSNLDQWAKRSNIVLATHHFARQGPILLPYR